MFRYMETPPPIADQMDNEGNSGNDWEMPTESVHAGEMHDASGAHIDPIHMISIDMGDFETASRFMDGLSMCSLAVSLGNVDTLVQHPASMTHRLMSEEDRLAVGITDGMVRISAGIESAKDIITDFDRAISGL